MNTHFTMKVVGDPVDYTDLEDMRKAINFAFDATNLITEDASQNQEFQDVLEAAWNLPYGQGRGGFTLYWRTKPEDTPPLDFFELTEGSTWTKHWLHIHYADSYGWTPELPIMRTADGEFALPPF